jgi:hypothetical protein
MIALGQKIPPLEVAAFLIFIQAKPYIDMDFPHQHARAYNHTPHSPKTNLEKKLKPCLLHLFFKTLEKKSFLAYQAFRGLVSSECTQTSFVLVMVFFDSASHKKSDQA